MNYKSENAIQILESMGWKWKGATWVPPRAGWGKRLQQVNDEHDAALWRVLKDNSHVETFVGGDPACNVAILIHDQEGLDLTDYGPDLDDIVTELAKHSLEVNHGIKS